MIVDDQQVFRDALGALVHATPGFNLVGEASCGEDALDKVEILRPEFVLIDLRMPGIGGVETARLLRAHHPELALLLVSAQPQQEAWPTACEELALPVAAKADLCPGVLREMWERRGESAG